MFSFNCSSYVEDAFLGLNMKTENRKKKMSYASVSDCIIKDCIIRYT